MKKTLIYSLILGTLLMPSLTMAQVVDQPATQAQVQQLEATIRQLLIQLIAQLTQQLNDLIAQQAQTNQVVANVQSQVDTVAKNTAPAPVASVSAPDPTIQAPVVNPEIHVYFGPNSSRRPQLTAPSWVNLWVWVSTQGLIQNGSCTNIHLTTDYPNGFYRYGGGGGLTSDQTFSLCKDDSDYIVPVPALTPDSTVGTYHFTASVVGTDLTSTGELRVLSASDWNNQ